ncbi:opioid-binding protein/cell adhesion molecule homolog [Alosa pseudoharengus]|uniref:opioid-binding protein/cell adhesion molecule homolog n=1 Tax=Alosa pseudoharengus TaxID=34774 RepID=UPI003F8B8A7A
MTQTFLSLLLLIVIPRCLGAEWEVTYSSTHICALEGSSVTMSCSYTYPSDLRVKEAFWINDEKTDFVDLTTKAGYKQRVKVDCGDKKSQCSLTINRVTKSDALQRYYCRITTNQDKEKWIGKPGVEVHVTDLHISSSKGTEVKEGDHVTLTCINTCPRSTNPAFTWSKDGRPVEKKQITNNQLQLHPVSYEDEGNYICAVGGHEGLPSPPYRLHVMYPPKNTRVVSDPSDEITEGTRVTLTCMSEADPPVHTYTWIKKSGAVELESGKEKTLTFNKISSEDSGEYICRADNRIGQQDSPTMLIKVSYRPKNTIIVSRPSGEITEGTRVTLICMSEADPPVHTYTWIKKSGAVELESGKENTLTFSQISSEDSGEYLCQAANRIGQQDSPAVLIKVSSVVHDQTILIAVLVGVAVSVVGLFCIICRLSRSKQLTTNNNRASGEDNKDDDVQYSNIDCKRSGRSRAAGPPSDADAAGGAEDDGHYSTIQPHSSRQTAGAQGDDVHYASVQFKKAGGAKSSPDQPEGEPSVIYSSVQMSS